jgi:two-component system response regulator BaeR
MSSNSSGSVRLSHRHPKRDTEQDRDSSFWMHSPREVIARVRAVLRRTRDGHTIQVQGLVLDEHRYRAALHGHDLELTAVEFKLLQFLGANPGRIYRRQQLMDKIYPDERSVSDRTIDSHIKKLRRKIEAVDPEAKLIHSVYGVGYKFDPDFS